MRRSAAPDSVRAYVVARLRAETEGPGRAASLSEIARVTGASVSHVSKVKTGKANVGVDFEAAIAGYWGMSVDELRHAAAEGPPSSTAQIIGGRLKDRQEWPEQLAIARQFFRTLTDDELAAVGDVYDHMDEPVTAEFIGYMAQALRIRRTHGGGRGNTEPGSGPTGKNRRAG
jgi:transcriptional regulator with XRE-family HTH domain